MKFDFLINIIFSHEYYNECIPSEIFEIEPMRTNRVVLGGPKYPFRAKSICTNWRSRRAS